MEMEQQKEWAEAQKLTFSIDLVEAAKSMVNFLAVVDRNRYLYEDSIMKKAIYRYNAFWLPLLAKHVESPLTEEPLVVPLDCEWIWHVHRLNPLRYKFDCEKLFGRLLGNQNVISTARILSKCETEEIWNKMYPEEPFELDLNRPFSNEIFQQSSAKFTDYDLVAGVKRQIPFTYQISRPHILDDRFLQDALARYKAFLHLIRTNEKKRIPTLCVPTYDIDLMWHTHQLYPDAYCKDTNEIVGRVLHHNDKVNDRRKGMPLEIGATTTKMQWEDVYGLRFWKAGAMHRGNPPNPVTQVPIKLLEHKELNTLEKCVVPTIQFFRLEAIEVTIEFAGVKHLPEQNKGNLIVSLSKTPDKLFDTKMSLNVSSDPEKKQVASLKCEPTGEFLFELKYDEARLKLGSASLSLQELLSSPSLMVEKWVSIDLEPGFVSAKPVLLHAYISFIPPLPTPRVFRLVQPQASTIDGKHAKIEKHVMDVDGKEVLSLHLRNMVDGSNESTKCSPDVVCITNSGEKHVIAKYQGNCWYVMGCSGFFKLQDNVGDDGQLFELSGDKMVKIFSGRRLDFELGANEKGREQAFVTAVEFSAEFPYGKAVALINLKCNYVQATEEWMVLPSIALAYILSSVLGKQVQSELAKKDGYTNNINIHMFDDGKLMDKGQSGTGRCWVDCAGCTDGGRKSLAQLIDKDNTSVAARCIWENEVQSELAKKDGYTNKVNIHTSDDGKAFAQLINKDNTSVVARCIWENEVQSELAKKDGYTNKVNIHTSDDGKAFAQLINKDNTSVVARCIWENEVQSELAKKYGYTNKVNIHTSDDGKAFAQLINKDNTSVVARCIWENEVQSELPKKDGYTNKVNIHTSDDGKAFAQLINKDNTSVVARCIWENEVQSELAKKYGYTSKVNIHTSDDGKAFAQLIELQSEVAKKDGYTTKVNIHTSDDGKAFAQLINKDNTSVVARCIWENEVQSELAKKDGYTNKVNIHTSDDGKAFAQLINKDNQSGKCWVDCAGCMEGGRKALAQLIVKDNTSVAARCIWEKEVQSASCDADCDGGGSGCGIFGRKDLAQMTDKDKMSHFHADYGSGYSAFAGEKAQCPAA